MIYETNSFQRLEEGQNLIDYSNPLINRSMFAMLLFTILILILVSIYDVSLFVIFIILIPTCISFKYTTMHDYGAKLKRSAIQTFGHDDEDYEGRI